MPHFKNCPWCNSYIWDWFVEWYLPPVRGEVANGRVAMDCPNHDCGRPVLYIQKNKPDQQLVGASGGTIPVKRPIEGATKWATDPSQGYPDLISFLTNPGEQDRARFFRSGYWEGINV
jgi:hypothetical protein